MRHFLILALTIAGLGLVFSFFSPWWMLALLGAIAAWALKTQPAVAWLGGFFGGLIFWGGMAVYLDAGNDGILSARMAALAGVGNPYILLFATALIGGLTASFGSLSGSLARQVSGSLKKRSGT